jgi:hypothetical protein
MKTLERLIGDGVAKCVEKELRLEDEPASAASHRSDLVT